MKHSKLKEKSEKVLKKGHKASHKKLLALVELLEDKKLAYKAKLEKGLDAAKAEKTKLKLKVINKQLDKLTALLEDEKTNK